MKSSKLISIFHHLFLFVNFYSKVFLVHKMNLKQFRNKTSSGFIHRFPGRFQLEYSADFFQSIRLCLSHEKNILLKINKICYLLIETPKIH